MPFHRLIMEDHTLYSKKVFEKLSNQGLSSGQPKILEYLAKHDGAVQRDIAHACMIEPATVTSLLSRMEKNGLIIRKMQEDNRRFLYVYLTEHGKEEAAIVKNTFAEIEHNACKGFTKDEIERFTDYLMRLRNNLND